MAVDAVSAFAGLTRSSRQTRALTLAETATANGFDADERGDGADLRGYCLEQARAHPSIDARNQEKKWLESRNHGIESHPD
jgi:hypothetical protein